MRIGLTIVALAAWVGVVQAHAEGVTDLDGWAKSFTDAAGKTDTGAMTALIRRVGIKDLKLDVIEDNNPNILNSYGNH